MSITRRDLIKLIPTTLLGWFLADALSADAQTGLPCTPFAIREYQGANLAGWEIALGDALYARAGEPPVSLADIETLHEIGYSALRANILRRIIMAHNITFKKIVDSEAFQFVHTGTFWFRLPYLPVADPNSDLNGQTIEAGIFIWDGSATRLDYGIAFQWTVNPWNETGALKTWNGTAWSKVGYLALDPDMPWHHATMIVDFPRRATDLIIDNVHYSAPFSVTTKPSTWGTSTDARFQVECVSIDPEPSGMRAMHRAQFKDWSWRWERVCKYFLPGVNK